MKKAPHGGSFFVPSGAGEEADGFHMARYVHFDVKASRRSRKQIQPISSEKIEICLVRFKSISSREHIHYFRKPREMGLFRESSWPIVSTLICSASAWDFIASTLIPAILLCAPPNKLVYFISINNAHHSILIVYKSSRITSHVTCSHQDGFVDSIRRLDSI